MPLSLSFFSIKRLPFGMLPGFMIIKTFCMSEEVEEEEVKGGWEARLIQFHSRQRYLLSSADSGRMRGRDGEKTERDK